MLGRNQARKHLHAAMSDGEVMIAAAKTLAATFCDTQPPAIGAVSRRELIEVDHTMGDAVNGTVGAFGREIVQRDDGGFVPREIVLQGQDLTAVAQRALRQKADLGQAVDDDALRPVLFDRFENAFYGFAEFEIRRIQQALMLARVENAFGRHELADLDVISDPPTMRCRAVTKFFLCFRQAHIEPALTSLGAR